MTVSNRLTIKRVFYIFYDALNPKPTQYILGRWGLHTNDKINLKADFANEDHCGTCAYFRSPERISQVKVYDKLLQK
jgi:hypothetical protein